MNCFNHENSVAVAFCQDCNKGLCQNCAKKNSMPICDQCNHLRGIATMNGVWKEIIITFGFGLSLTTLVLLKASTPDNSLRIGMYEFMIFFYCCSGIVAGWKTLNRISPNVFIILPLIGWLIYFIVKLLLSFWVGIVMLPIRTINNIAKLIKVNKK